MSEPESDTEGETITTYQLIERSAEVALELQHEDGSFSPTRTGVDGEPRTPVRATASWLLTLVEAYELTDDEQFADAAHLACDYLLSEEARPHGYTFHTRSGKGKDKCDGLVGQAGPIRALARAGEVLQRAELTDTALEVFNLHPFDEQLGVWERREITGELLSYDRTLNHQLIFAAASTELADHSTVDRRLQSFLDHLEDRLRTREDGVIIHYAKFELLSAIKKVAANQRHFPLLLNELIYYPYLYSEERREKEVGYHPNNLHYLARLNRNYPDHEFWNTSSFKKSKQFMLKDICEQLSWNTAHGSPTPGLHYALPAARLCESNPYKTSEIVDKEIHYPLIKNINKVSSSHKEMRNLKGMYKIASLPNITLN